MEPPLGVMDNKSHNLCDTDSVDGDFLTLCDLGDEEIHFSRNASDYYYQMSEDSKTKTIGHPSSDRYTRFSGAGPTTTHSLDTSSLNFGFLPGLNTTQSNQSCASSSSDQVKSSRLLNTIGGKLRRGSRYLNAPTRLIGQYLLGITIQSWSEFFNTARMMKAPCTRHQLTRRLVTNLSHFQGNYLCVSLILVIYCILTSPLLLIVIAAYLMALYLVTVKSALGKQARIFGYRLNLQQQYSFITMLSIPPLWIAGAPSAVFWVIGASFFVVGLHASMYANDQILNEQSTEPVSRAIPSRIGLNKAEDLDRGSCLDVSGAHMASRQMVSYYNHYPNPPQRQEYYSLPQMPIASTVTGSTNSSLGSGTTITGGSYVSNTISQWITFGSSRGSSVKYSPTRGEGQTGPSPASGSSPQLPEVKVISQDYAGLGRVYEI